MRVIKSMTGYGRAVQTVNGREFTVELRSVNNRYLDCTVKLPRSVSFAEDATGICSLFCLGPDAHGVTIQGLHYPLENGTLTSGFPLGVSNHFVGKPAKITVRDGSLLALWDRKNGFPERG